MKHREDIGLLRKTLNKFSRYLIHLQDTEPERIKARANVYRHLANFQLSIDEVMKRFEAELIEAGTNHYFPDLEEKVAIAELPNGEKYVEVINFTGADRRAAENQRKAENKAKEKAIARKASRTSPSSSITARLR